MVANKNEPKESAFRRLRRKLSTKKTQKRSLSMKGTDDRTESDCSCSIGSQIRRVFNYFDENGDGRISAAELQRCLRVAGEELSMEDAEAAVESSDLNGDGHLDLEEFRKLMETSKNNEEEKRKELSEAFRMYVMEGSSFITAASLRRMLSRLGDSRSVDDCKAMIRAFDLDGDGVLSFDEFAIMMH
ncbi:hypothetical protein JRO89_XS07G0001000 [Xanthoceras sorbifolium]|uniref:EF-hand domain-containing protein n=1 Tax=Xanthoceras sorbifolium TaxID=99658 RepID=A0ABQ8HRI2_9ROSI|nr:hypothetical protein JRO89_XS07G0001000 [Xanthoceras sorbifolium]